MSSLMATVADVIIEELKDAGVRTIFGVPGGAGNLDLMDAAGRAGLRFVLTATETAAAIAALAETEVTGGLGACLTTLGPGAASVVNGVACALLERAPVLVFSDSHGHPMFEHQRLAHSQLFTSITNATLELSAASARATMVEARQRAMSPRPGPVHIDCPGAVCQSPEVGSEAQRPPSSSRRTAVLPSGPLPSSTRPLLLVGLGARRREDADAIRQLCERRRIPAMVTYKAKGVVPDDHPWFAGVFTNGAIEQPVIDQSDLLIGIGLDPVELLPRPWKNPQPLVYGGPWPVEDAHVPFSAQHIAPASEYAEHLETILPATSWDSAAVRSAVACQRRAIDLPAPGLTAQRVVELAAHRFAGSSRVTVDAGAHMFPATILWPVSRPGGMLISNGLSTMGFALPAAIGAALADPSMRVVALTGDGGLVMCMGELLTAARERLRLTVVVFNDSSLSLIEIKQQARRLSPAGVALGHVDWRSLATSLGLRAFTAATEAELAESLGAAESLTGPSLIEAKIDRTNYGATLRAIRG